MIYVLLPLPKTVTELVGLCLVGHLLVGRLFFSNTFGIDITLPLFFLFTSVYLQYFKEAAKRASLCNDIALTA